MKKNSFWLITLSILLVFSLLWGFGENRSAAEYRIATENQNRRAFSDFVTHLDNLETNMAKSRVAGTPLQQVYYLGQSEQQSEITVKNLSQLPAEELGLSYIDQFLNQIGEFSGLLARQITKGDPLTTEQEATLDSMHERLIEVNRTVQEIAVNVQKENIAWLDKPQPLWTTTAPVAPATAQGDEGSVAEGDSLRSSLEKLDASLQKLPPFSYSGQTDVHAAPKPLGLPQKKVSEDEARHKAQSFLKTLGYSDKELTLAGTSQGVFGGYIFTQGNVTIDVCKQGGVITLFRDERDQGVNKLSNQEAAAKAMQTLHRLGWKEFVPTAIEDFGAYIQLEAINKERGVRIYPDKIRLKVSKDNGSLTSYDATAYWLYNHSRNLTPKLSMQEAQAKLRPEFKVKEKLLAIISRPGYEEALCYEFRGRKGDEEFLIYINALDGTEEKIQRIVVTPRGEFWQ
ncbi:MAG: PepSY1/2 domain-containing protein [Desulfitobacteriia bacterium]|jgi:spore germination protein